MVFAFRVSVAKCGGGSFSAFSKLETNAECALQCSQSFECANKFEHGSLFAFLHFPANDCVLCWKLKIRECVLGFEPKH